MLNTYVFRFFLVLLGVFAMSSCTYDPLYLASDVVYRIGDDRSWINKNIDDSDWKTTRGDSRDSIFWVRMKVTIEEDPEPYEPLGIQLAVFGAYEAYWDEVLIGVNDTPGAETLQDRKGNIQRSFIIPDSLSWQGEHVLALRTSQKYENDQQRTAVMLVTTYDDILQNPLVLTSFMHILAGAFLIAAIYFLIFYIQDRKGYPILLFSISCFLFFALIILEYLRFYVPIHYTQFYTRLEIIGVLTLIISFLIPYYFSIQFSFMKPKYMAAIYAGLLLYIYLSNLGYYDHTAERLGVMMWIAAIIIVGFAVYRRTKGAMVVLAGLCMSAIVYYVVIYDISLFVSFAIVLFSMFYILSLKIKEQRQAYEDSILQSIRLKHELLKKKIQPHFLMNTLTSLIDWVEEAPNKGVLFIEALAEEFDLLNQVEDQTLIPLLQEIKLCQSHLTIMRYRKEIEYIWEDEGVDPSHTIPPAVIHTLLENGITHCIPSEDNSITFRLIAKSTLQCDTYTFLTLARIRKPDKQISDGTGFGYIKSRFNESYKSQWKFTSEPITEGWKNTIVLYK